MLIICLLAATHKCNGSSEGSPYADNIISELMHVVLRTPPSLVSAFCFVPLFRDASKELLATRLHGRRVCGQMFSHTVLLYQNGRPSLRHALHQFHSTDMSGCSWKWLGSLYHFSMLSHVMMASVSSAFARGTATVGSDVTVSLCGGSG